MLYAILFFTILVFMYLSVAFRLAVMHPFLTVYYAVVDFILYIMHKKWRICPTGKLICYTALFGKGKTLSVVNYIVSMYMHYNNKLIYDTTRKKWVKQRVHIISNVDLNIPYEHFVSLEQVVRVADIMRDYDLKHDTLTVTLVLGDEFSVQMNSREFKKNIDPLFLNTLLTCRHHHITLVYDAQRFNHVDALLRQVTSYVVECNKIWRFMCHSYYDAYALENATDPTLIRSYKRTGFFVRNRDFSAYDTLACVGNLQKSFSKGDMLSESEILDLQRNNGTDMNGVANPSRRYLRTWKKKG